ncbi:MAG: hypothetical protein Q7R39_01300 [Dehalococcoidia bacterium]|nr:hypothetical protein [Dehalococcoidia bacterium]
MRLRDQMFLRGTPLLSRVIRWIDLEWMKMIEGEYGKIVMAEFPIGTFVTMRCKRTPACALCASAPGCVYRIDRYDHESQEFTLYGITHEITTYSRAEFMTTSSAKGK